MKKLFTLLSAMGLIFAVHAQSMTLELEDSTHLKKCEFDKQYNYENYLSPYPPKKKNNWAIGIGVGSPMIMGDVRPLLVESYAADLKIRKAISHVFSLRLQSIYADITGIDYKKGLDAPKNHKTRMTDHTLQAMFTLNNINFHNRQAKIGFNFYAGAGFATNYTRFNLLDENGNSYDYSGLSDLESYSDRRFSVNEVLNILDDGYETVATWDADQPRIKSTTILPTIVFGGGMDIYLSKRIDLSIESRLSRHFTDQLDGIKAGPGSDWFVYSGMGLNFKIGKHKEPLYWQNPLDNSYDDIMTLKKTVDPEVLFQDIDQDGVADMLDRDSNTPLNTPVSTTGVSLDSDNDGVPDYRDKEIYSPVGAQVSPNGMALDTDGDGVADVIDEENNTPAGASVDVKGREIQAGGQMVNNVLVMRGVDVWSIFFDSGDFEVKEEYHAIILNLASYMIEDKEAELIVTGYTDSQSSAEYNLELSKKRANSVVSYFTKLGISANRFDIQFKGEQDPLINEENDLGQQLNRRVTLRVK